MKNLFKTFSLLLTVATVSMTSCSEELGQEIASTESSAITFTEDISLLSTKATDAAFDNDDAISVTAYYGADVYKSNAKYTYSESIFSSTDPIVYTSAVKELSFVAVYPYMAVTDGEADFTIKSDQSVAGAYSASDLMSANLDATSATTPKLTFYHRMSKIVFDLDIDESIEVEGTISPKVNGYTTASDYNFSDHTFTASNYSEITMASNGDNSNSYKAIIAPAKYTTGDVFATMEINGSKYEVTLANDYEFCPKTQYTYIITIVANEQEEIEILIELGSEIIDWNEETIEDDLIVSEAEDTVKEGTVLDSDNFTLIESVDMDSSVYAFIDYQNNKIYSASAIAANEDNIMDDVQMVFYNGEYKTYLRGPAQTSEILKTYDGLSELTEDINTRKVAFRVLDPSTSAHKSLIDAYENEVINGNTTNDTMKALAEAIELPISMSPILSAESPLTSYDDKTLDGDNYKYALVYENTASTSGSTTTYTGTAGIMKVNSYTSTELNFDYLWGITGVQYQDIDN